MSSENDFPTDDSNFEEYKIVQIELDRERGRKGMWVCTLEYGFVVEIVRGGPIQPRMGQTIRVYGDVEDEPQGIFVDGKKVYLRTDVEQENYIEGQRHAEYMEALERFNEVKDELYRRQAVMPASLKEYLADTRKEADEELGEGKFDVLHLERELELCDHAVGLEILILDGPAGLGTFFNFPDVSIMALADRWQAMSERMENIGTQEPTPRTKWARGFLKHRRFNIRLSTSELQLVQDLAMTLIEGRSDGRNREIAHWLKLSQKAKELANKRHVADPELRAEFEQRTEEINAERQDRAAATLSAAQAPAS